MPIILSHFGLLDMALALDCDAAVPESGVALDINDCTQRRVDEKE
jgi:hypothetical protein